MKVEITYNSQFISGFSGNFLEGVPVKLNDLLTRDGGLFNGVFEKEEPGKEYKITIIAEEV